MTTVRVTIHLPYLLILPPGDYPTPSEGSLVRLRDVSLTTADAADESRTEASGLFDVFHAEPQQRQREAEADRLLRRINHLLRWYRAVSGNATIVELTRANASPFWFTIEASGLPWGDISTLEYELPVFRMPGGDRVADFGDAIRRGLAGKTDPDVATLNLLDAEYALSVGRFREAVLLCWGAIDSTFVRKFKSLVNDRLPDEWGDAREFLKGIDFGLRHKMTTGLRLLAGRSLYAEPDGFWQELSASYGLRNRIIHDGQIAHEDDAKRAIKVARKIVGITAALTIAGR